MHLYVVLITMTTLLMDLTAMSMCGGSETLSMCIDS